MFVSTNLNIPGGFVLDYVEEDLYMYRAFLHNRSLNYIIGTDGKGNVSYVHISEKGSSYKVASFIINKPMTLIEVLTTHRGFSLCRKLIP